MSASEAPGYVSSEEIRSPSRFPDSPETKRSESGWEAAMKQNIRSKNVLSCPETPYQYTGVANTIASAGSTWSRSSLSYRSSIVHCPSASRHRRQSRRKCCR